MKNKGFLLLLMPFLFACKQVQHYDGIKYVLPYQEEGELINITPKDMFQISSIDKKDSVFLIGGLDGCSGCIEAETQAENYAKLNHCYIYMIDIDDVTFKDEYNLKDKENYEDSDYFWLYYSTVYLDGDGGNSNFALPLPQDAKTGLYLPIMYFYKYGGVGYKTNADFGNCLRLYVEVAKAS